MEKKSYRIIFRGEILDGQDPENVKRRIARLFRIKDDTIKKMFSGKTVVIKKKASKETAIKYKKAFEDAGARCRFVPIGEDLAQEYQPQHQHRAKKLSTFQEDKKWDESLWRGMVSARRGVEQQAPPQKIDVKIQARPIPFRDKPPLIEFFPFSAMGFFVENIVVILQCYIIIGFFTGPKKIFGFLVRHIKIDGKTLTFDSMWTFIYSFIAVASTNLIIMFIYIQSFKLIKIQPYFILIDFIIFLILLPLPVGFGTMALLQSLLTNTTDGERTVCAPLFGPSIGEIAAFIKNNFFKIYLWGLAGWSGALLLTPVTWTIILKEWYSRIEIDGYRYRFEIPWTKVIVYSLINTICFGLYVFKYLRYFHEEVLPEGEWVKISEESVR